MCAVGTVTTPPEVRSDSAAGIARWTDRREGRRAIARVEVRYDHVFLQQSLLKPYLQAVPALWDMSILRQPRGTKVPVAPGEWHNPRLAALTDL